MREPRRSVSPDEVRSVFGDKGVEIVKALYGGVSVFSQREDHHRQALDLGRTLQPDLNPQVVLFYGSNEGYRNDLVVNFGKGVVEERITHFLPGGLEVSAPAEDQFVYYDKRFQGKKGSNQEVVGFLLEALDQMRGFIVDVLDDEANDRKLVMQ